VESDPRTAPTASPSWRRDLALLVLTGAILFGFGLGSADLANPDEGRYAEIPREMLAREDWVTPQLNDVVYFEKPPLVYWMVALCLKVFGPSEWSMRLVPALFGLGGLLMTYAAGRSLYGRNAGLAAAGVLATSLLYFALSRVLILDMVVSVLMSATLFCFILGVRAPVPGKGESWSAARRWLFYGLYASAAMATLTKGLMGFLVTGAVMFLWLLVFRQWHRLRPLYLPTGSLIFLAIAAPWHVLAALRNPTWTHFYFVREHWERFTLPDHGKTEPWWYFVPILLVGIYPWTGFLAASVRNALTGGETAQPGTGIVSRLKSCWAARGRHVDAWFLVTWAAFVFLFFSKSQSKIATYILPMFPPLAVLIGAWVANVTLLPGSGPKVRWGMRIFAFVSGILATGMLVAIFRPGLIIKYPEQAIALRPFASAAAVVLLTGGILSPWLGRVRSGAAAIGGMGLTTALFFVVLALAAPDLMRPGTKPLARQVAALVQPGDRVMHYHEFFHDFLFYAQRPVDVVAFQGELELEEDPVALTSGRFIGEDEFRSLWVGPGRVFAVARTDHLGELFADPAFAYHLLGQTRNHSLFSNRP
jgi:4-amino-4-deoxy-L-arabinose transferase-like glycosyltransferase